MKENQTRRRGMMGRMTSGGRNLLILGIASTLVALATTAVSLVIYHNSGDIYLDRSRPGYLPDEEEVNNDDDASDDYDFAKVDELDMETVEEYLKNLDKEVKAIDSYNDPFGEEALSDEGLGITENN